MDHAGQGPRRIFITTLLGIAGAMVGGFLGSFIGIGSVSGFNFGSIIIAVAGALLLLWLYKKFKS